MLTMFKSIERKFYHARYLLQERSQSSPPTMLRLPHFRPPRYRRYRTTPLSSRVSFSTTWWQTEYWGHRWTTNTKRPLRRESPSDLTTIITTTYVLFLFILFLCTHVRIFLLPCLKRVCHCIYSILKFGLINCSKCTVTWRAIVSLPSH